MGTGTDGQADAVSMEGPGWHSHGKLRHAHAHAHAAVDHHHLLRAVCGRAECAGYPTHNIHREHREH